MSIYTNYLTFSPSYTHLWGKYRPAILKLMIESARGPQQYKFSEHEIKAANPKERGGYAFGLKVHKNRAINNVRSSGIAKDLLLILQQSQKASELTESSVYEFRFDKHYLLHVTREELQGPIEANGVMNEQSEQVAS